MNHYKYEALIFAEGPLPPAERTALEAHLQECQECSRLLSAWQGVQAEMQAAPALDPQPGFTARWQARLDLERQQVSKKQVGAVLGFSLAGAGLLLVTLVVIFWPVLESPKAYLYAFVYQAINLLFAADMVQGFLVGLTRSLSGPVSVITWIVLLGLACQLAVIWLVSLRIATKTRRV